MKDHYKGYETQILRILGTSYLIYCGKVAPCLKWQTIGRVS